MSFILTEGCKLTEQVFMEKPDREQDELISNAIREQKELIEKINVTLSKIKDLSMNKQMKFLKDINRSMKFKKYCYEQKERVRKEDKIIEIEETLRGRKLCDPEIEDVLDFWNGCNKCEELIPESSSGRMLLHDIDQYIEIKYPDSSEEVRQLLKYKYYYELTSYKPYGGWDKWKVIQMLKIIFS